MQEKARKGKGKARNDLLESCISRMLCSVLAAVSTVMVAAVATAAIADTTLKATEAACKAAEHTGAQAIARPAANQGIGLKIAEPTLLQTS